MHDPMQFYPTPPGLAERAWSMFRNTDSIRRILEPSAGRGDLLNPLKEHVAGYRNVDVDCVELNIAHHPVLRGNGYNVVDTDFLQFRSPVVYSHILMNPPFAHGVDHLLHAWDLLRDGEIVCILNAETIDNPYTEKRKFLRSLIEEHGRVEYAEGAFEDPDTLRKTSVRVAIVHLEKHAEIDIDIQAFGLDRDAGPADADVTESGNPNPLALPHSAIENAVRVFDAAVEAMIRSVRAEAEANYYEKLLGSTIPDRNNAGEAPEKPSVTYASMARVIEERYDSLKQRAWGSIIHGAEFLARFSSGVRREIEAQLAELTKMQFTTKNIYALLEGLMQSKTELDYRMLEEVFDEITKYHTDNRHYYRGWKSNDKHRIGYKIRATRFILPRMKNYFGNGLSWEAERTVYDIDRAFAMLDGKMEPMYGILDAIRCNPDRFASGKRISSDYFDIRFYSGIGTLHFFPARKDLVERLNRVVGARRRWLPVQPSEAPDAFWTQYENADRVTKAMQKHLKRIPWYDRDKDESMVKAHEAACDELGIPLHTQIGDDALQILALG